MHVSLKLTGLLLQFVRRFHSVSRTGYHSPEQADITTNVCSRRTRRLPLLPPLLGFAMARLLPVAHK